MLCCNSAAKFHLRLAALSLFIVATPLAPGSNSGFGHSLTSQEREVTAQKFVQGALRTWQDRLNLREWDIRVELVRPSALEPKTLGNIHWDMDTRRAAIDVLSAYDYTLPMPEMLNDMELTVVHELIHLHLASLPRTESTRRNEEYVVNQISRALLDLSRR
jgi:hypothetical protein